MQGALLVLCLQPLLQHLLLRNVTSTNRLKSCFPGKPTGTQTASQPILLSCHCLPLCPLYLQTAWTGQQLKWIPGSSKPTKKKARHPPEADGLVLQVLFIFSAHQERLADLLEGWPILLGFGKCLFWQCGIHTGQNVTSFVPMFQGKLYQENFISAINTKAFFCLKNTGLGDIVRWTSHCFSHSTKTSSPTPNPQPIYRVSLRPTGASDLFI